MPKPPMSFSVKQYLTKKAAKMAKEANVGLLRKYLGKWKKYRNPATIGMRSLDPFPQRKYAKMVMVQNLALVAPVTNLSYEYIYRLNSTFAPDLTGASGRQPYGRDTLAALYSYYQVMSAHIELEFYDTDQDGCIVGYQVQGDTISGLTVSQIDERPWAKCTSMSNTGEQKKKYFIKVPMSTALGVTHSQYKNDTSQYASAYNASPTQGVYLRLFALSTVGATATNLKLRVKLTQHCIWYTRTSLAQS